MIVGNAGQAHQDASERATTLDDLFRRAAVSDPDAIALADPDDRTSFTDGAPKQLTYAQADRVIWVIAARLRELGLQNDAVIGFQLPNSVECVLTLLGILRAGLIAAPLPMLWRENEIIAALSSVGAKAFLTTSRIGDTDHCALAGRVAAGLFSIRHVCAFGEHLSDGVVPFDDVFAAKPAMSPAQRDGNAALHAAVVTFEPTPRGILPVVRNHKQLIAAGMGVNRQGRFAQDSVLLSATASSTFAGLSVTLMPWLLSGGRLVLHQPFDIELFHTQARAHGCNIIALPGPLATEFNCPNDATMIVLWRAPERLTDETLRGKVVDVTAFGEYGLHPARRGADGKMVPLGLGPVRSLDDSQSAFEIVETKRSTTGSLALRGVMVASPGFAAPESEPVVPTDGFVNTGYPCRIDPEQGSLIITGPQPGMIVIGGYRISRNEIDAYTAALPTDSPIAALPDGLLGQRLRGRAIDPSATARAARGANPLIARAFQTPPAGKALSPPFID